MNSSDFSPDSQSLAFIEELYEAYKRDPGSVSDDWSRYFDELSREEKWNGYSAFWAERRTARHHATTRLQEQPAVARHTEADLAAIQHKIDKLVRNYRVRGHIIAKLDPLGKVHPEPPELDPHFYGLTEDDFSVRIYTEEEGPLTVKMLIKRMRNTYCRYIGAQFMHIDDLSVRQWLQDRMERTENRIQLSRQQQIRILNSLSDAVIFEDFIQKKYIGAKSFSLEGAESLIPLLDMTIEKAGDQGIQEIVIGMAHRGRLNVLANIMGKDPRRIFREFEDIDPKLHEGRGDVKYHLGYHNDWTTSAGNKVHLSLLFNPSHLEFVNPVVLGRLRAHQDRECDHGGECAMGLLIHGDAAFAGEGIVQETLNLSELAGYSTGGTVHVILNNQIGFTTDPNEGRSSTYCTDIAKMLQSPVLHVNGEDPESVAQVVSLAVDFRNKFKRDVVIDMYCFRRRGHNEGDEPGFTQPLMYQKIRRQRTVYESYRDRLLKLGGLDRKEADEISEKRRQKLEEELSEARRIRPNVQLADPIFLGQEIIHNKLRELWSVYRGGHDKDVPEVDTGVAPEICRNLIHKLTDIPDGFHPHSKIQRLLEQRRKMGDGEEPFDWATAESLAFASLAAEGIRIRMSGQDSQRGTFSQRHSVLHDIENGNVYMPLQHLSPNQGLVEIFNSPLSEVSVVGYEYGYSVGAPDALVIWEAQFGDFINCAQVIIDQFIASGEDKWRRLSGLVMLLPHGMEGQGPEHSSARLERFLQLAAEDNLQVVYPTTPAQYFHLLRRQILRTLRKPLIVMSPKSMLRNPKVVSPLEEFSEGAFHRILADTMEPHRDVNRILLCSGKIYYELEEYREKKDRKDVAILRVEQIYPLSDALIKRHLSRYNPGTEVVWVQEEPENMGAWRFMFARFGPMMFNKYPFRGVSRPTSASPATGSAAAHKMEQKKVINQAFAG